MDFMSQKSKLVPTAKPGNQYVTVTDYEVISDEKGARVLVTFSTEDGAKGNRMFFEKSMMSQDIKDMDKNFNNMKRQLALEEATPKQLFKRGTRYYANLNYAVSKEGYNNLYINIHPYSEPAIQTEEPVEI